MLKLYLCEVRFSALNHAYTCNQLSIMRVLGGILKKSLTEAAKTSQKSANCTHQPKTKLIHHKLINGFHNIRPVFTYYCYRYIIASE